MTKQQIEWAQGHDWFIVAIGDGAILVMDVEAQDGRVYHKWQVFTDYRALRQWAGY